jgi:outer membrane immunogenic protein
VQPAPIWSWSGFYIGAHVGAGWGTTESDLRSFSGFDREEVPSTAGFAFSQNSRSGFLGGGQVGYNWQAGWAVFGVQADIAGTDIKGTTPCVVIFACTTKTDWLATATGRLGAVVADRGLIYLKGGGAWMNANHRVTDSLGIVGLTGIIDQELTSRNSTSFGWLLGFGTEWMITPNWTAFIEYNYIEFDTKNEAFAINPNLVGPDVFVNADIRNKLSIAKIGVNYKFDWGKQPVVARY